MAQYYMFICPNCGKKLAATKEEAEQIEVMQIVSDMVQILNAKGCRS